MNYIANCLAKARKSRMPALPITFAIALLLCLGMSGTAKAADSAAFVSQSVPEIMVPGQVYAVSVTMQNTGTTTWSTASGFYLHSQNPVGNTTWGLSGVQLPNDVAPGQSVTFSFNATAPSTTGIYNFQWRMLHNNVAWFGASSTNVEVSVGSVNNAQFVSQTVPTSMNANQTYAVSVTMRNNGSNTWAVGDHYLRSQNPQDNTKWDLNRVELPNAVAPGENVTFNFSVKPTLNGTTSFQWRMAQGTTSFGALSTNVNVAVSGTNNAAFVSQSVPEIMVPGQVYAVSVTMQNTGTNTWSEANSFRLGGQNPQDNSTWGVGRVYLSGTVSPGASHTFNFNVTAPTPPGVYNFQWKMVRDGVQWFGALTQNVEVAVGSVNNAQFVSQTVPTTMTSNQTYAVSVTMRNNGSNTWAVGDYYLRSQNPEDNTKWNLNRVELPNAVAPGENVTFNFSVKPTLNGTTNFRWRMAQGTTSFGALSTNVSVAVNGTDNAAFVSQSVPGIMVPGQVYAVSVTMQNTGTNTWRTADGFYLHSQNPVGNTTWGLSGVQLPNAVAPGENVTFNFNVTAPTTPGTYNFQWRMLHNNVAWFGSSSTNVAVQVNGTNNSQFVSQTVPGTMAAGYTYPVSVTLQNTGTAPWVPGNYFLGSENPEANTTWGLNRVELAAPVAPGANVTLNFNVTAPSTPGTYEFQWRLVQNSTRFGALTTNVSVNVTNTNDAAFVSQNVPNAMITGQLYAVSVTMQNTGGTIWTPGAYFLGSENPEANSTWGLNRVDLTAQVLPGANVTLYFNITAPAAVGTYNFQWRMVQNSTRFGALTTNLAVSVQQAQAQALYYVHADHLNTPRLVADATGTTVWRWDQQEPFGANVPDENPSGLGAYEFPLRFPGQYSGKETNLSYNHFRDYDQGLGRYVESDPIGLVGGINTFAYVQANPMSSSDPRGLDSGSMGPYDPPGRPLTEPSGSPIRCVQDVRNSWWIVAGWNGWRKKDKRLHCVISCEISRKCGGESVAWAAGWGREAYQLIVQGDIFDPQRRNGSTADEIANGQGRRCPLVHDCYEWCTLNY